MGRKYFGSTCIGKGIKERKIYLPKGKWYRNNGFNYYEGTVTDQLKMEEIPVYIKAGSFIPTVQQSYFILDSSVIKPDAVNVAYYYDEKPSAGILFYDDGNSKTSIASGKYEVITFNAVTTDGGLKITIKNNKGNFTGKPKQRLIELQVKGFSRYKKKFYINGEEYGSFSNEPHQDPDYVFALTFTGEPLTFELK